MFQVLNIIMHCTIVMFSEYVKKSSQKEGCYSLRDAGSECRGIIVNVRRCKLDNGQNNGLKFQEYYNVSIYHDQTNGLKTNLFLNRYNYCVVERE